MRRPASLMIPILLAMTSQAAAQVCKEGLINGHHVTAMLEKAIDRIKSREADKLVNEKPPLSPPSASDEPTSAALLSSVIDGAQLPDVLALALGSDVNAGSDGAATIKFSGMAIKNLWDPETLQRQTVYESRENAFWRRVSGTLAFGGRGLPLDTDGDGMPDDPVDAADYDDQVSLEVLVRIGSNSRDRRDPKNFELVRAGTKDVRVNRTRATAELDAVVRRRALDSATDCYFPTLVEEALNQEGERVAAIAGFGTQIEAALAETLKTIDARPLHTLVLGHVSREDLLGPDSWKVGWRSAWARDKRQFTFNLDYSDFDDHPRFLGDLRSLRGAGEYKVQLGNGSIFAAAASLEAFKGSDLREDDELAKFGVTWSLPLKDRIPALGNATVQLKATWANNTMLLDGEDELIGHVGLSWSLEQQTHDD